MIKLWFLILCLAVVYRRIAAQMSDIDLKNLNVDIFFKNEELMKTSYACLLDKGPCNLPVLAKGREMFGGIVESDCAKCPPGIKSIVKKFSVFSEKNYPKEWQELMDKYDSKKEHRKHFSEFAHSK